MSYGKNGNVMRLAYGMLMVLVLVLGTGFQTGVSSAAPAQQNNTTNTAPHAQWDDFDTNSNGALVVPGPGVLANDWDADGDTLTAELVTGPNYGVLNLSPDGGFTYYCYTANIYSDSFSYRVFDGTQYSDPVMVTIYSHYQAEPYISYISDQYISVNETAGPLEFYISDPGGSPYFMNVYASSDDPYLVQESNIIISGDGPFRTVTVIPESGQWGTVLITLITYGSTGLSASTSFYVNVSP
ncbi:Ig-like domain-containing protein [Paenibacillus mesotrionivorans]|uniref:Ig-like domain-containing protein n=1 Tax=Paenibacillus mesotrionivorans TaxID=3160968 RepID=A0ACC7P0L1_9BACL